MEWFDNIIKNILRLLKNSLLLTRSNYSFDIKKKEKRIESRDKEAASTRKSNGEAFVRLIAIQESVEIMKGADWSIGTK